MAALGTTLDISRSLAHLAPHSLTHPTTRAPTFLRFLSSPARYVLVKLLAETDEISMDDGELEAAEWMSQDKIKSMIQSDPKASLDNKVSPNNCA